MVVLVRASGRASRAKHIPITHVSNTAETRHCKVKQRTACGHCVVIVRKPYPVKQFPHNKKTNLILDKISNIARLSKRSGVARKRFLGCQTFEYVMIILYWQKLYSNFNKRLNFRVQTLKILWGIAPFSHSPQSIKT